ncbi:MAG: hypothetical protein WAL22_06010 [Solirubrobacteraceae bacterium]
MKRIALIATAVAMLIAATAAFAATSVNTYKATYSFSPKSAGSAKKPVKTSFKQNIQVTPGTAGDRAGVLLNIKTTIYGVKVDGKDFPTCPASKITSSDTACPKGALVATGSITAVLGSPTDPTTGAADGACNPLLHVWNGGQGKLVFFFVDGPAPNDCLSGAITTGSVPPYPATYKQVGKNVVVNVPIPKSVDYPSGLVGSLESETLNWKGQSSNGHISIASVGCKGSKRPYSTAFTAAPITSATQSQTVTVSGSAPCSK